MKSKSLTIAVAGIAAAMVCIVAVLAIRMNGTGKMPVTADPTDLYAQSTTQAETFPVYPDEKYPSLKMLCTFLMA